MDTTLYGGTIFIPVKFDQPSAYTQIVFQVLHFLDLCAPEEIVFFV